METRCIRKRRYRCNDKRIKDATALFAANADVSAFLEYVSHSCDRLLQCGLAGRPEDVGEEHLLGPLAANIPAEYDVSGKISCFNFFSYFLIF